MIIIISKNYLKNALASAIFSVLSMRYCGYTYLWSLPCISHAQVSSAYVGIELNYVLWLQNRTVLVGLSVENLLVIQGVTLCSVLSGSAIPFPASEGKSVKISVLRGDPEWDHELAAAESGFVAAPVQLALNHNTVNRNSAFEVRHHGVMFIRC